MRTIGTKNFTHRYIMLIRKSILLLPFLLFAWWFTSCSETKQGKELNPTQQPTYISLGVGTLRSHGEDTENPGTTNPNTDVDHREDLIKELRLILFPSGAANASLNIKFDATNITNNRITFRLEELRAYDIYIIANESASGQSTSTLAFLASAAISRSAIETFSGVNMVGIVPEQMGSGVDGLFMMTAVYKNVVFSRSLPGSGSLLNPYRINLHTHNTLQRPLIQGTNREAAEMMRSLAKMEITLKDIVEVVVDENGNRTYNWILPWGYAPNSRLKVELLNMPKQYTLFPRAYLTDVALVGKIQDYIFSFIGAPQEENVVLPPNIGDASIGGILTADYKLYIYLPEYLAPQTLAEQERPGVKISYYSLDPFIGEKSSFYPIQNAGSTHYETVLMGLNHSADWSVFRNRLYKMKVNIKGLNFSSQQ